MFVKNLCGLLKAVMLCVILASLDINKNCLNHPNYDNKLQSLLKCSFVSIKNAIQYESSGGRLKVAKVPLFCSASLWTQSIINDHSILCFFSVPFKILLRHRCLADSYNCTDAKKSLKTIVKFDHSVQRQKQKRIPSFWYI